MAHDLRNKIINLRFESAEITEKLAAIRKILIPFWAEQKGLKDIIRQTFTYHRMSPLSDSIFVVEKWSSEGCDARRPLFGDLDDLNREIRPIQSEREDLERIQKQIQREVKFAMADLEAYEKQAKKAPGKKPKPQGDLFE